MCSVLGKKGWCEYQGTQLNLKMIDQSWQTAGYALVQAAGADCWCPALVSTDSRKVWHSGKTTSMACVHISSMVREIEFQPMHPAITAVPLIPYHEHATVLGPGAALRLLSLLPERKLPFCRQVQIRSASSHERCPYRPKHEESVWEPATNPQDSE